MIDKNLVNELAERIECAKEQAQLVEINPKDHSKCVFVQEEGKTYINPKYMSPFEYLQLAEFEKFLKEHDDLENVEIDELLRKKIIKFATLRKMNYLIPNFVDELKNLGVWKVAIEYVSDLLYSKK